MSSISQDTMDFKSTSQDELNILELINSVGQLDIYNLRQIFLLLTRNFYNNPRAFNADGISLPASYYQYTYTDKLVDPEQRQADTLTIDLDYSSAVNSIDKTDYLVTNQKPAIYVGVSDFTYESASVLAALTNKIGDIEEKAVIANTNIVLSHYANSYDDAAKLASLSMNYFIGMRDYIKSNLKALYFTPVALKSPIPQVNAYSDSAQKYYMAQSIFQLKFESNWMIRPEAVLIKKFALKLNTVEGIPTKEK
jgi:hypothetical protein